MSERPPNAPQAPAGRAFRTDILIAVCALLVSSLATAASWWQSRVVATQLSSQVWPYLAIVTTTGPDGLAVEISNEGLGPAVVRTVQLTVDGKPYPTLVAAERALLGPNAPPPRGAFSEIANGSVLRSGRSITLFKIANAPLVRAILPQAQRVDLRVCYCSILGDCWTRAMLGAPDPVRTHACPADGAAQYRGAGLPP